MRQTLSLLIKPVSGRCNLRCAYCFYRTAENAAAPSMTPETADLLIRRIAEFEPAALSVSLQGGEPTLWGLKNLKAFVAGVNAAVSCPVSWALQTNATLLTDDVCAFLKQNGFLVGVSLDGDRAVTDRFRLSPAGESVYGLAMRGVRLLEKHSVDFNVLSVVHDENARALSRTWAHFAENGFRFLQFIPCIETGGVGLSAENYEAFLKESFDLWYAAFERGEYISVRHIDNWVRILMGEPPENCAMRGVCGRYYTVEAGGEIYPCDFYCAPAYRLGAVSDAAPFGPNAAHASFIEASGAVHAHCAGCAYHYLCRGGCRRDRTDGGTKNRYCRAYYGFFEYALPRLQKAARVFGAGETFR